MHHILRGAAPLARWGVLLLLASQVTGRAQLLKMGPIDLGLSLNSNLEYTDNYSGLADGESPPEGIPRDDAYLSYGFTLSGQTVVYPNINLNLSASLSKETHFIQDQPASDSFPFLGSSNFNLNRTRGRYNFSLGLGYNANSEYDKSEVFRPSGTRKARDITQTLSADLGMGWTFSRLGYSASYAYGRERHSEDFKEGDNNSHSVSANAQYSLTERIQLRTSLNRTMQEQINVENDVASGKWEQTIFAGLDYDIFKKPSLRYSVGGELEDDEGQSGKWEPQHTLAFSDSRQLAPTLDGSVNANYSYERDEESDDISFTYGANLNQKLPYRFSHNLSANRQPVSTFGTTATTDSTSLSYGLSHPSFFIRLLNMNITVSYSHDVPKGVNAGPTEDSIRYGGTLSRSFSLSRKWSSSLGYSYSLDDREVKSEPAVQETVTEQRITLSISYTLF